MPPRINDLGLPIGEALPDWTPAQLPKIARMEGRTCDVELADSGKHAANLFAAFREDTEDRMWTYMSHGPFETLEAMTEFLDAVAGKDEQIYYVIVDKETGKAVGIATYLRIKPKDGVVEVGSISYAPRLQRTVMATEAMYLMMAHVFDVFGYRRYEWKCDALNAASCRAAERLGFTYDGLFRKAVVYRGRNRDTAWYSILDDDWPALKGAFQDWLAPENFDAQGQQKQRLSDLIASKRAQT